MSPSLVLPVSRGQVVLGSWQQIVLCDFGSRPRQLRIELQVMGI